MNGRMPGATSGKDWLWEPTREAIYHRDGDRCIACHVAEPFEVRARLRYQREPSVLSIDHVDPRGGNAPANLVTLCNECNVDKGERSYREWNRGLVRIVAAQLAKALDRPEGRRRVEITRPGRIASHQYRSRRDVRRARAEERARLLEDFCS